MAETIGLKAVLDLSQWNKGIASYTTSITSLTKVTGTAGNTLQGQFVGMGQSVLKFGAIAGGIAVGGAAALTAGIVGLGAAALGEVSKFERMTLSITNLVAREISGGKLVEQARQTRIQLGEKEAKELEKLPGLIEKENLSRSTLAARIQEQKQRIIELTAAYGDNGLNVQTAKARLAEMESQLGSTDNRIVEMQGRITELNGKQGQLVTTLEKVRVGQISMAEAMSQAAPRAQELIKWIQILAIQSPFTSEGIQSAFQTALAYGFTTEQAQRLTEAEVDFVAATGKSAEAADLIALALGQIQARGKLSAQELRQLSEHGVGVNKILEDMGFSLDDVTNGLVPVDKFMEAVIKDMEVFKGAAKAQATTFSGLVSSLDEIKSVGLREFFTGTFEAIRPYLANFVDFLTKAAFETGSIRKLGDTLGRYVGTALSNIAQFSKVIQAGGLAVFSQYLGTEGIPLWYELQTLIGNISGSLSVLGGIISGNLSGPMSDFTTNIIPMITQGLAFINDNFEAFKGALMGIGVVLGGAVFAALAAGLLSLLTPINLIIAGAALLGAAWAGNWGDIQGKTLAAWAVIQPVLQTLITWLQTNIPVAIQALSAFWTNTLLPALNQVGAWMTGTLLPVLSQLWTWLQVNIPIAITYLSGIWNTILLPALLMAGTYITGTIIPTMSQLWTWLQTNVPQAVQSLAAAWSNDLLPALTEVWQFISGSLFPLLSSIGNLVNAVLNKAIQAFAGIWKNILLPALSEVWKFLQDNVLPIFASLVDKIAGDGGLSPVLKSFTDNVLPPFKAGMDGIKNAIKQATDFFNSLASAVSNFELPEVLQPGSPTPFEIALTGIANAAANAGQAIGAMISPSAIDSILGLNRHIADNANIVEIARRKLAKYYEANNLESGKRGLATRQLTQVFKANQAAILSAANPIEAFRQFARQAGILGEGAGFSGEPGKIAQGGFQAFLDGFREATATLKKAQQEAYIQAGRTALTIGNQLNEIVTASADILDERIKTLQDLVSSGETQVSFEGTIISATEAQLQLNQALEDQLAIQEQLRIEQENERKLSFLEKQLDLVETINKAGLNVQDILGGLKLGLGASIPDMIAATNKLVSALIAQTNANLVGITGRRGIGFQAGTPANAGGLLGLGFKIPSGYPNDSYGPMYAQSGEEMLVSPRGTSIQDLVFSRLSNLLNGSLVQGSSVTNNYNFNMTVNSGADANSVIRQYGVMRGLIGT